MKSCTAMLAASIAGSGVAAGASACVKPIFTDPPRNSQLALVNECDELITAQIDSYSGGRKVSERFFHMEPLEGMPKQHAPRPFQRIGAPDKISAETKGWQNGDSQAGVASIVITLLDDGVNRACVARNSNPLHYIAATLVTTTALMWPPGQPQRFNAALKPGDETRIALDPKATKPNCRVDSAFIEPD